MFETFARLLKGRQKTVAPEKEEVRPDKKVYSEPFEWLTKDWKPDDIATAVATANEGDFTAMCDLISSLLKEDDRVGGALQQRKQGLTGLPLTFTQEDGPKRKQNAIERAIEEDWWEICPEQELSRIVEWGLMAGMCPVEAVWELSPTSGRMIPKLKAWNPKWLTYQQWDDSWTIQTREHGQVPMNLDDPNNSKWFLFCPFGKEKPWNEGLWRRLAYWTLAKRFVMRDWARYSEVCGFPTWVIETPEGWQSDRDRMRAANDFIRLGRDKAVALPKGVKASVVECMAPNWQGFQQLISEANLAIIIAIMGQNLTSEVSQGARASTVVHAQIANDLLKSDAHKLEAFLHYGPFKFWTAVNHGSRVIVPWLEWDTTPPVDMGAKAEMENKVMMTAVIGKSWFPDFDERTYVESYKMPWLPEGTGTAIPTGAAPVPGAKPAPKPVKPNVK